MILSGLLLCLACISTGCSWFQKSNTSATNQPTNAGAGGRGMISNSSEPPLAPASYQTPISQASVNPDKITNANYLPALEQMEREQKQNRDMQNRSMMGTK